LTAKPIDNRHAAAVEARDRPFRPSEELRAELDTLMRAAPDLHRLLFPQPDEPDLPRHTVLCTGHSPYYVVEIEVPGRPGRIWASRLPGIRPAYTQAEVDALKSFGITRVVCLVPTPALEDLHGAYLYLQIVQAQFPESFHQVSILDHQVPADDDVFERCVEQADRALQDGEQVLVHCVGGCGRTGMFAACVMVRAGLTPRAAIATFRRQRRCGPETDEQIAYVVRFARRFGAVGEEPVAREATPEAAPPEPLRGLPPGVRRLHVCRTSSGEPRELARGGLARIHVGRLHFEGGGRRRVTLKRFRYALSDDDAAQLHECIQSLVAAGVRLPRMGLVRLEDGAWVQVAPLFGSLRQGSKLHQPAQFFKRLPADEKAFVIDQLARVAGAGYQPAVDLFVVFRDAAKGALPIDLDLIVPLPDVERAAFELLKRIIQVGDDKDERDHLLDVARAAVPPDLRAALDAALSAENSPFVRLWAVS